MNADNPFESPGTGNQSPPKNPYGWLRPFSVLGLIGAVMALMGVAYGVLMVGIPSQDPTPEMVRSESMHLAISNWTTTIGSILILVAVFAWLIALVARVIFGR